MMKTDKIKVMAVLAVALLPGLTACTDVESITLNEEDAVTSDTRYEQYLSNLTAYKEADHKVVYGWFDNSEKSPSSLGQHITSVPDSVDVLVMATPELADFEQADLQAVHEKGTRVACAVSFDDIKAVYDALASDESTAPAESFDTYLTAEVENILAQTGAFDGLVVEFTGQNPDYMREPDRSAYIATQSAFLDQVAAWKSENASKMLSFRGKPQNLSDKTLLQSCEHIILDSEGAATTPEQLTLLVKNAQAEGVPSDRFVMAVSTVSLSSSDTETGYWGSARALAEVACWATVDDGGFVRAGIAIDDIQNDYYATNGLYTYVKEAINIMNPAPVN